jgi:hypothetical protein
MPAPLTTAEFKALADLLTSKSYLALASACEGLMARLDSGAAVPDHMTREQARRVLEAVWPTVDQCCQG